MTESLLLQFANRLTKTDKHRRKLARRQEISCFRVYDHDLPEFPLVIDRYNEKLYIARYKSASPDQAALDDSRWEATIATISQTLQVPASEMYFKERRKKSDANDQYQKLDERQEFFIVDEGGLQFYVSLTDYLDTGLFLDHRLTRDIVRQQSRGKRVLNLFAYTGSFSVYAADGAAAEVTSVDLSNTYLKWAKLNFKLNRLFDETKHHFVRADVKTYLSQLPPDRFDVAVMDPPTFSNSKAMADHLDIQRDHAALINQVLATLTEGGVLYFSTNSRKFKIETAAIQASLVRDITRQTTPFDFQEKMRRWCFCIVK